MAPPIVHEVLRSVGRPLEYRARELMESRFGHDFSQVRIHDDDRADRSAKAVNAVAYTVGHHIAFAAGRHAPDTSTGLKLLAHELTHVVQQGAVSVPGTSPLPIGSAADASEAGADAVAEAVIRRPVGWVPRVTAGLGPQALRRACGPVQIGTPVGCTTAAPPGVFGPGPTYRFTPDCDTFSAGEEARLIADGGAVPAGSTVEVHGYSSTVGDPAFNTHLACARALAAQAVMTRPAPGGAGLTAGAITRVVNHGPTAGPAADRRSVVVLINRAVPTPADLQISGLSREVDPSSIFFDRGNAVLDAIQSAKIPPLAAPAARSLTLFGFISEDENIPALAGTTLVNDRLTQVNTALAAAGHTGVRSRVPDTTSGEGNSDYRRLRKVVVRPAGGASGQASCATPVVPCSPAGRFTTAQTRADALLGPAITALGGALTVPQQGMLDGRFGSNPGNRAGVASTVKKNLEMVRDHIATQMTPELRVGVTAGHRCANECLCGSGIIAFNNGLDAAAVMTLCDTPNGFMREPDVDNRAFTLIHEGLHGITLATSPGLTVSTQVNARDISYDWQRLFRSLPTGEALRNNDSYVVFLRQFHGLAFQAGPSGADIVSGAPMSAPERSHLDDAIAWVQGLAISAHQEVDSAHSVAEASIRAGSWTNSHYEAVMELIARRIDGLTLPPAVPTATDKVALAALNDRLRLLARAAGRGLTLNRLSAGSTSWSAGPGTTVDVGADFFAQPDRPARIRFLADRAFSVTSGLSSGLRPVYIDLLFVLWTHRGRTAPPP